VCLSCVCVTALCLTPRSAGVGCRRCVDFCCVSVLCDGSVQMCVIVLCVRYLRSVCVFGSCVCFVCVCCGTVFDPTVS